MMHTCPCCKSENTTNRTKFEPGFRIENGMIKNDIQIQYSFCNDCGVMFHPPRAKYGTVSISAPIEIKQQ